MRVSFVRQKRAMTVCLCLLLFLNTTVPVNGCGPEYLSPVFVFEDSPDLPFEEFAKGNIGIIRPSFGRKTLVIAHRYLSGGGFTAAEQSELVAALKAEGTEDAETEAMKAWIAARKEVVVSEEKAPEIYEERRYRGYDFFPNCTADAFKVATQTLKDRVASYGADNAYVQSWLQGQDIVFRNCSEGSVAPPPPGPGSPQWFQKDREYQIAAASFYSLNFSDAQQRFRAIAGDAESVWQDTAKYLVGRTLVRAASLAADAKERVTLYRQAEGELLYLAGGSGKYGNAAKRLIAHIKYKLRPEERVGELGRILDSESGNDNIKQDLIDYTWLLDKFDAQVQKEEEERKKAANPTPSPETAYQPDPTEVARREAVQRGELIQVWFSPTTPEGTADYNQSLNLYFKADINVEEVQQEIETRIGRKLTPHEIEAVKDRYDAAQSELQWNLSPNRKFPQYGEHEGCSYPCFKVKLDLFPEFLRADEVSDWILTFESDDPLAYDHAFRRWRRNNSHAWLVTALSKASASSRSLATVMREAERILPDSPAYPSVAYQLVRLRSELNQPAAAKKLLDQVDTINDLLPASSRNLFREQRMKLATSVSEFLRYAPRRPAAFYKFALFAKLTDIKEVEKSFWDEHNFEQTKEEWERSVDEEWIDLIEWDDRYMFDDRSAEILNWHFPVQSLLEASHDPALPDYLRRTLTGVVWTRAVMLNNESMATRAAKDAVQLKIDTFADYLNAKSGKAREVEALYILLKNPGLSPFVKSGVPELPTGEKLGYYFDSSWWCKPDDNDYGNDGTPTPRVVTPPPFFNRELLAAAKRERAMLVDGGDANRMIGKRTLAWAREAPDDPRIPESLFIALRANEPYKYGCNGWEDDGLRGQLETLLRERYPNSQWTSKLDEGPAMFVR